VTVLPTATWLTVNGEGEKIQPQAVPCRRVMRAKEALGAALML